MTTQVKEKTINTYLQRMQIDKEGFLNYAYMGYAEYEGGATRAARLLLAQASRDSNVSAIKIKLKSTMDIKFYDLLLFSTKECIDSQAKILNGSAVRNKGVAGFGLEDTVAWLGIGGRDSHPNPEMTFMLFRPDFKDKYLHTLEHYFQSILDS